MYKLIIDKPDIFEATINIEGAESKSAKCRLVVEANSMSYLFEGTLKGENCRIPIKKLKNYLQDGDTGTLRLEVIADDTYFSPWQSEFKASVSRKVTAEVAEPKVDAGSRVKVIAEVKKSTPKEMTDPLVVEMAAQFAKFNMKLEDAHKRKKTINHVVSKMISEGKISEDRKDDPALVDLVLNAIVLSENRK